MTISLYSFLYAAIVYIVFYIVNKKARYVILSLASICYIFLVSAYAGAIALFLSLLAWLCGLWIQAGREKAGGKAALVISIIGSTAVLILFKYDVFRTILGPVHPLFNRLIMPIGISFYLFRVLSYVADIYEGKIEAEKNVLKLVLYLLWFPTFISGPIERMTSFQTQMENLKRVRFLDWDRKIRSLRYIAIGVFYKLVLADRLGLFVDTIYTHVSETSAFWLLTGAVFYSIQIYCDFAGYSFVATGISNLFGISIMENFDTPYLSENITEFWRRWHISLSIWLRDYIYIPLGGNRKGTFRKYLNIMMVFVVSGIWHGADISFLVWGILHGLFSVLDGLLGNWKINFLRSGLLGRVLTFSAATLAWIFFRADTLPIALTYIQRMVTAGFSLSAIPAQFTELGFEYIELIVLGIAFLAYLVFELSGYCSKSSIPDCLGRTHYLVQYSVIFLLFAVTIVFGIYGMSFETSHLIYMQF